MKDLKKVIIIGASGYIGKSIKNYFEKYEKNVKLITCSPPEYDLLNQNSLKKLNTIITKNSTIIVCSGLKKQRGDNLDNFNKNILMISNLISFIEIKNINQFIYFSSAEVYGEDINDMSINENSVTKPTSYYGIAKLTLEDILVKYFSNYPSVNLMILRPALVYGLNEEDTFYGPSGFIKKALNGEVIELWGDGTELREFVFIDDLITILIKLMRIKFTGKINIVNGKSYSFVHILEIIKSINKNITITSKKRSRVKVDQGYDNGLLKSLLPEFKNRNISEIIKLIYQSEKNLSQKENI